MDTRTLFAAPMSKGSALSSARSISINGEEVVFPVSTGSIAFWTNCRELIEIANNYMAQPISNSKEVENRIIHRGSRTPIICFSIGAHRGFREEVTACRVRNHYRLDTIRVTRCYGKV